MPEMKREEHII